MRGQSGTRDGHKYIVFLMMENHSFDNFLGMLGRGDGLTTDSEGQVPNTNPYANGSI
jgi:phospholipase C